MNNQIEILTTQVIFENEFSIYGTPDNPLFLAKDIAKWIDHKKTRDMVLSVDNEEKMKLPFKTASSRSTQEQWFLTEDGMYEVLMQSRKPIAKEFKKKVKKILKQIRTTGGYIAIQKEDTDEDILARAIKIAERTLLAKDKLINEYEEQIRVISPKATAYDDFLMSNGTYNFATAAKILSIPRTNTSTVCIGRNTLLAWLRRDKILMATKEDRNIPYQKYVALDYFDITPVDENGSTSRVNVFVTPKGLDWLYKKYRYDNMPKKLNIDNLTNNNNVFEDELDETFCDMIS